MEKLLRFKEWRRLFFSEPTGIRSGGFDILASRANIFLKNSKTNDSNHRKRLQKNLKRSLKLNQIGEKFVKTIIIYRQKSGENAFEEFVKNELSNELLAGQIFVIKDPESSEDLAAKLRNLDI